MSKYEIPFFNASIQAFGRRFSMTRQAAYRYLREHKGLAFLIEFYDVEHLQSMDAIIDDLIVICQKNGGTLAGVPTLDGVVLQLTNYRESIYSPEEAARSLQDKHLDQQYFFGPPAALQFLHNIKVETV